MPLSSLQLAQDVHSVKWHVCPLPAWLLALLVLHAEVLVDWCGGDMVVTPTAFMCTTETCMYGCLGPSE